MDLICDFVMDFAAIMFFTLQVFDLQCPIFFQRFLIHVTVIISNQISVFCSSPNMKKQLSLMCLFFLFTPYIIGAILSKKYQSWGIWKSKQSLVWPYRGGLNTSGVKSFTPYEPI